MSLPIRFRRQARREFDQAADWYHQKNVGLGMRFTLSVEQVLFQIAENAHRYPEVFQDIREGIVQGFPYCVYYRVLTDQILVLSVFHTSRNPESWQSLN